MSDYWNTRPVRKPKKRCEDRRPNKQSRCAGAETNCWINYVKQFRVQNPEYSWSEALKAASEYYREDMPDGNLNSLCRIDPNGQLIISSKPRIPKH